LFYLVVFIEVIPSVGAWHSKAKKSVAQPLQFFNLLQGEWDMYAPDPADREYYTVYTVQFTDGIKEYFLTPKWEEVSSVYKFVSVRHVNLHTHLPHKENIPALEKKLNWIASRHPDKQVARVSIVQKEAMTKQFFTLNGSGLEHLPDRQYLNAETLFEEDYVEKESIER